MSISFLEHVVQSGIASEEQVAEAVGLSRKNGLRPEDCLVKLGYIDQADITKFQSTQYGYSKTDLANISVSKEIIATIPESVARENIVIPLRIDGDSLVIAIDDPMKFETIDKLRFLLNREIKCETADRAAILTAINSHYGRDESESVDSMIAEFTETQIDFTQTEIKTAESTTSSDADDGGAPIIRLVNLIISEALTMRTSDIHIEPFQDRVRIRYRIDGKLVERDSPPKRLLPSIISRIKIMARMDISEKRRCQDGRIKTRAASKEIDLRVSIMPTNHGQAVVMRILDRDSIKIGIRNLGLSEENYRIFNNVIRRPNGIFLVTGPTGSGKTTTLYSALGELNRPDRKIITAEDPVEYILQGINQVEVKTSIGLTFASVIRAMLRQAPNIILVGEIRDLETAEMAIQASLTGHLVFSTLHTNDAPGAVTRLIDMHVQPFLVASSLMAVLAQRLSRRICAKCNEPYTPTPGELQHFDLSPSTVKSGKFMRGRGCSNCNHTGFRGRVAIFEMMVMNSALREMTFNREPSQNIRRQARLLGMKTLVDDCLEKAIAGVTHMTEVYALEKGGH